VFARAWFPTDTAVHVAAALAGLVPAWLSYRYIEQPIRMAESWRGKRALLLVVSCVAISVVASRVLAWNATNEARAIPQDLRTAAMDAHAGATRGCTDGPRDLARCTTEGQRSGSAIVLVGDSNADHFTEPVEEVAARLARPFIIAARTACPFADVLVHLPGRSATSCLTYVRSMIGRLIERKPALVVIASASSVYMNNDEVSFQDASTMERSFDRDRKVALWTAGVRSIVQQLATAQIPVLIVHTIPNLRGFALATCPYARMVNDQRACSMTVARDTIEAQQRFAREAERAAVAGIAGARTLDVTDQLCSATECSAWREDHWLYRDEGHLSVRGAKSLTPLFGRAIEELR
jgi:hypothetical protein